MNKHTQALKNELLNCGKMPLFEIAVVNKSGEQEYILCDIFFRGNSIVAQRDQVSKKEARSKFIASTKLVVDSYYGLDHHLQELHSEILNDICDGDLFTLGED
jgi:hypothetical protein